MDRTELIRRAADRVQEYADSGMSIDPQPMRDAMDEARRAGISLQEIADYNHRRPKRTTH